MDTRSPQCYIATTVQEGHMNGVANDWRVRLYTAADIPAYVELSNLEYPDEPTTVEQEEHWERSYPQENPRLRLAVEDADGHLIAFGESLKPFWAIAPGVYNFYALAHPQRRGHGIGRELLARLDAYARGQGAEKLRTACRESQAHSIRFLERAGFSQFGIRFESAIDLAAFDPDRFAAAFERVAAEGYRLVTLAELRAAHPNFDRELYEVENTTLRDVPLPGGEEFDMSFEQWRKNLDNPTLDPDASFVALHGEQVVGLTMIEQLKDGPAITDATGVLREHRNRGVALALKVKSLAALKASGRAEARTHNDTANPSIIHLNEKLGYTRLPGWLQWERPL
jgi:GNAT superfamily N-acetyltransferase